MTRSFAHDPTGNRPARRFRKTAATVLAEEGVREDVIDKIMGWSPTTIRQRYYTRVADGSLYEAILKLYQADLIERACGECDARGRGIAGPKEHFLCDPHKSPLTLNSLPTHV